jgi:hypothetical protein
MTQEEKRNFIGLIEEYLVKRKWRLEMNPDLGMLSTLDAEFLNLIQAIRKVDTSDIKEIFTDLRDYWDTLEVDK